MTITESPHTNGVFPATDHGGTIHRRITGVGGACVHPPAEDLAKVKSENCGVSCRSSFEECSGGGEEEVVSNGGDGGGGGGEGSEYAVKYAYRASAPTHRKIKESPLSSDAIFRQSHAGLFNLCVVILVAVNSRLIIENLMKYGLLIRAGFWFSSKSLRDWPLFMCGLSLPVFPLSAFVIEKLAQQQCLSDLVVILFHTLNIGICILYPVFLILRCDSAVLFGVALMLFACTMWLKLVSFVHTNYDMRAIAKASTKFVSGG
ncbi:hypothetical protein vseg_000303 [Gypsophila vaccaria]